MLTDQQPSREQYLKGYIDGLTAIAFITLRTLPQDGTLPDDLTIAIKAGEANLSVLARQAFDEKARYIGQQPEEEQYVCGYAAGYLFSLHALPAGMLRLLVGLTFDERVLLMLRFTLDDPECEPTIEPALKSLRAMHRAYRMTLN